jgi:antitoxin HicB
MMNEKHLGSSLDHFLEEEGRLIEAEAVAAKRVLAFQIAALMEEQRLSTGM